MQNFEKLEQRYPGHEFSATWPDNIEYSDVEIIIDGRYSGIWIDDWMFYGDDDDDFDFMLSFVEDYFDNELN